MNIIEKPWGMEELLECNENYVLKKLTMWKGKRCSLQYHNEKHETIFIHSGKLSIHIKYDNQVATSQVFEPGESVAIPPKVIHRMEAVEDCVYIEASTPQLADVIRLSDDYNRL